MRGWGYLIGGVALAGCGTLVGSTSEPSKDQPTNADASSPDAFVVVTEAGAGNCSATPIFEDHFPPGRVGVTWNDTAGDTQKLSIDGAQGNASAGALVVPLVPAGATTLRQALARGTHCVDVKVAVNVASFGTASKDGVSFLTINFAPDGNDRLVVLVYNDRTIHLAEQNVTGGKWEDLSSFTAPPAGKWATLEIRYDTTSSTITFTGPDAAYASAARLPHGPLDSVWLGEVYAPGDATGALALDDFELR